MLISGLPDIDVEDMKANTEYVGYSKSSAVIMWFWQVVENMSKEVPRLQPLHCTKRRVSAHAWNLESESEAISNCVC